MYKNGDGTVDTFMERLYDNSDGNTYEYAVRIIPKDENQSVSITGAPFNITMIQKHLRSTLKLLEVKTNSRKNCIS